MNASHAAVHADDGVHSHTFAVTLYIRQKADDFVTYDKTEKVIQDYLKAYTGKVLNEVPPFDTVSPTIENIGEEFFTEISLIAAKIGHELIKLEISESPQRIYSITVKELSPQKKALIDHAAEKMDHNTAAGKADGSNSFSVPHSQGEPVFRSEEGVPEIPYKVPPSLRPASNLSFFLSLLLMTVCGFAVMTAVRVSGEYPLGLDIYGHLFKADLLYHEILKGNFYPLFTQYWYNGVQPFRYWPPMTYYFMSVLQFIGGGDVMQAYLGFVWAAFTIGGTGWVLFCRKMGRPVLGAFLGLMWFMFPDNLRVLFGEGNLPRVFITMLLPYIFYCMWQFVCYQRKKMIFPLVLLMLTAIFSHLMISAMIGVASAVFLFIYALANRRWKESVQAISAMLFSFAVAGIWVFPSLVGGLTSMSSDGSSALMASLSTKLSVSLNPFLRQSGNVTDLYFGLSIALIALIGVFLSNRKSLPGFCTLLIVIMGTTTALNPLIKLLPLSQLFWGRRFAPIAYAVFVIAVIEWRNLKRPILIFMCAAILADCIPSFNLEGYDAKMNVPATIGSISETMDDCLFTQAKEITRQRVSLMDLGILGPLPSYAFGTMDKKTQYIFGWAWQGAATANNIAYLNESLEKENYLYMFDRNLELGADTVLIDRQRLTGDADRTALVSAAERVGYEITGETDRTILFSYPVSSAFGVITKYSGLAIGTTAALVPGILPSFHPGDKQEIDSYTVKELEQYDSIYLSGFFYNSKKDAEKLVREVAADGVKVYVDMSRIPADPLTNQMTFLGISAQPITFYDSYPELITDTATTTAIPFADGYEAWNTVYLTGLEEPDGYAWFENTKLNFVGTDSTKNITFLGFNLLFHAYTAGDPEVKALFNSLMELDTYKLPERSVVPLTVTYETNQIIIQSDYDNVNTTIAWQDTFSSKQKISSMNNFLIVNKGTTVIHMTYPYLSEGILVSAAGILLEAAIIYMIFRKPKEKSRKKYKNVI